MEMLVPWQGRWALFPWGGLRALWPGENYNYIFSKPMLHFLSLWPLPYNDLLGRGTKRPAGHESSSTAQPSSTLGSTGVPTRHLWPPAWQRREEGNSSTTFCFNIVPQSQKTTEEARGSPRGSGHRRFSFKQWQQE